MYSLTEILVMFAIVRVLQRIYYLLNGHVQHGRAFSPPHELKRWLKEKGIPIAQHRFVCKNNQKIELRYRRIGTGPKLFLLANGVGTDLFMWLPVFKAMLRRNPRLFTEFTLIAPSYRGLFGSGGIDGSVEASMSCLAGDVLEILAHCSRNSREGQGFDSIVGWSMGAQVALTCVTAHPHVADKLFLLNPSGGRTLHTAFQPFVPIPYIGKSVSSAMRALLAALRRLTFTVAWKRVKTATSSIYFRLFLELFSLLGGFPPELGAYFEQYLRDVFSSRAQTRGLLDLILSLDDKLPDAAFLLEHKSTVVSSVSDFLTGVYHGMFLCTAMINATFKPVLFGSHFLLLEWPDSLAKDVLELLQSTKKHALR
ncbi:hypothetical protein CYMTET_40263 [Cymbomonas tetramitiformis]|uniref:AB hydrolase-1 domain-containing protein n=1 Tax=Cymbomonas tetramitiformis TaxID=36881 RepID=A0AAE0C9N2_9CHLO|nr:hypothetical protein CYMTET_40263 [Cymbomonas tetramitiformis]|eukprot:gene22046-26559_t